jgi:hypothetical protein
VLTDVVWNNDADRFYCCQRILMSGVMHTAITGITWAVTVLVVAVVQ